MTDDELSHPVRLYYAIKALPGWYQALDAAQDFPPNDLGRAVGAVVSSVLLSAGEEAEPVAVTGQLDDDRSGRLVIVYPGFLVTVEATTLGTDGSRVTRVRYFDEISELAVETRHSYFDGVDTYPRTRDFAFTFLLDGEQLRLAASNYSHIAAPEVKTEAIYAAFVLLRDARVAAGS
ncbi:hypothetical protein ACFXQA_10040 [Microbacterium sp. P07]|uniref:hypothetical protein n=1 Tax=Microbacterium sp. P07 TaxID=3366952 RepID=UPI0037462809